MLWNHVEKTGWGHGELWSEGRAIDETLAIHMAIANQGIVITSWQLTYFHFKVLTGLHCCNDASEICLFLRIERKSRTYQDRFQSNCKRGRPKSTDSRLCINNRQVVRGRLTWSHQHCRHGMWAKDRVRVLFTYLCKVGQLVLETIFGKLERNAQNLT